MRRSCITSAETDLMSKLLYKYMRATCVPMSLISGYDQCNIESDFVDAESSDCSAFEENYTAHDAKLPTPSQSNERVNQPTEPETVDLKFPVGTYKTCEPGFDSESDSTCFAEIPASSLNDELANQPTEPETTQLGSEKTPDLDPDYDSDSDSDSNSDSESESVTRSECSDAEHATLMQALHGELSTSVETDDTIWLIRNSQGNVGYLRATRDVLSFFARVLEDYKFQYGWESIINTEWHSTNQSGLKVEFVKSSLQCSFPMLRNVSILETYHTTPCNPVSVSTSFL
jgi:hypothetical protein